MREDKFITSSRIENLHLTKGTHWILFINQFTLVADSYGCPPRQMKPNSKSPTHQKIFSLEYQTQKTDSNYPSYCLYMIYLTKVFVFKKTVLSLA